MKCLRFINQPFILHDIDITPESWFSHDNNAVVIKNGRADAITIQGLLKVVMIERLIAEKNGVPGHIKFEICKPEDTIKPEVQL